MENKSKTITIKGKEYTLTVLELHRANQMYKAIPHDPKTVDDWQWAVEMALQETADRRKKNP